ncbi:hypothetical protein L209DRAFT_131784 [Thermothelomyces heterothallicus CBS 203.75]
MQASFVEFRRAALERQEHSQSFVPVGCICNHAIRWRCSSLTPTLPAAKGASRTNIGIADTNSASKSMQFTSSTSCRLLSLFLFLFYFILFFGMFGGGISLACTRNIVKRPKTGLVNGNLSVCSALSWSV